MNLSIFNIKNNYFYSKDGAKEILPETQEQLPSKIALLYSERFSHLVAFAQTYKFNSEELEIPRIKNAKQHLEQVQKKLTNYGFLQKVRMFAISIFYKEFYHNYTTSVENIEEQLNLLKALETKPEVNKEIFEIESHKLAFAKYTQTPQIHDNTSFIITKNSSDHPKSTSTHKMYAFSNSLEYIGGGAYGTLFKATAKVTKIKDGQLITKEKEYAIKEFKKISDYNDEVRSIQTLYRPFERNHDTSLEKAPKGITPKPKGTLTPSSCSQHPTVYPKILLKLYEGDLQKKSWQIGDWQLTTFCTYAKDIAHGLHYLENRFDYTDLKLSNILFHGKHAVITDWGNLHHIGDDCTKEDVKHLAKSSTFIITKSTFPYKALQQLRSLKFKYVWKSYLWGNDKQSKKDLQMLHNKIRTFSFGIILFQLLTDRNFIQASAKEQLEHDELELTGSPTCEVTQEEITKELRSRCTLFSKLSPKAQTELTSLIFDLTSQFSEQNPKPYIPIEELLQRLDSLNTSS